MAMQHFMNQKIETNIYNCGICGDMQKSSCNEFSKREFEVIVEIGCDFAEICS